MTRRDDQPIGFHENRSNAIAVPGETQIIKRISERLGSCEVCGSVEARYTCPKCELKTCSVRCVGIHKKELACNGIRDRTKFISLREMTERDFMNDYYFLEEVTRYVDDRKSDKLRSYTRVNRYLTGRLRRLKDEAFKRKVRLKFVLPHFSRHIENTTFYNNDERQLYWRISLFFPNAEMAKYTEEKCGENMKLCKILDKYVNVNNNESVPMKHKLEYYQSAGIGGIRVLLKAEDVKRSGSRFYELDLNETLRENFCKKTIIEFPVLHVTYDSQANGYDVIESDEDVANEAMSFKNTMNAKHRMLRQEQRNGENLKTPAGKKVAHNDHEEKRIKNPTETVKMEMEGFSKEPNNFLFMDESLWDMSSHSSDDNEHLTPTKKCKQVN